jgi:TolB-like protein/Tfp pilus assembly protein PilF
MAEVLMRYRFDEFEIDADRYEFRRNGAAQAVEPLVFDLLLFLARNPGRVVSRDEVVATVWEGRAVSEATISSAVKSARRALGDTGDSQNYLRTIRGRGFEFRADVRAAEDASAPAVVASPARVAPAADTRPVIAVLPFTNLSTEADEYFADGLTEDITTNLSRFRDVLVIGSASAFRFKGKALDLAEARERLGAGYFVQGSVRRAGGRVRISAQLVDGMSGVQLWGERYDREMGDLFALQDEVTRTIAATLGVTMQGVALQRALLKNPAEQDAYDLVLRARRYTSLLNAETHAEARDLLERAVELNPLSADAHAMLANVYLGEHRFDMNPRPNPIGRAMVHALAATRLDPQNAYARCWLAIVHFFRFDSVKFFAEAELALQLNPNDPETLADIGHYYSFMGEFERGVELSRRACDLNPLHSGWYRFSFARWHYDAGRYADSLAEVRKTGLTEFYWRHLMLAAAMGQLGDPDVAEPLRLMEAMKPGMSPEVELRKWNCTPHDREHIMDGLRKAGLKA